MQRIYECNDDGLWRARDDDDDYAFFFFFFSSSLSLFFMIRRIALIGRDKRKKTEEGRRNEFVRERERERSVHARWWRLAAMLETKMSQ